MTKWISKNRWEFLAVFLIILISAFLRFYRLTEYMTFLGDEGRDALIVKKILIDHVFPLIGPPTSVGNMYLGPLYYYMMAVPMAIFGLNPVSAAGMVAIIGTLTVGVVYLLGRRWFGIVPALLSAILYSVSPVNIIYSRSSWNPNPAPFFALLAILGLDQARRSHNFRWFILTGISLSFVVQMHYLALILLPIFGLFWIYELVRQKRYQTYLHFFSGTVSAVIAFLFLMSPLVIFDFRHNFINFRAATNLFGQQESAVGFNLLDSILRIAPIYSDKLIGRYIGAEDFLLTILVSLLVFLPLVVVVIYKKKFSWPYFVLGVWLLGGLSGLSLYKQSIYDHYLGFLNPVPFLLLGGSVAIIKNKLQLVVVIVLLLVLGSVNLQKTPLLLPANYQLSRTEMIANFILEESKNQPLNFALIAKNNYDAAYQYYLDLYGNKPRMAPMEITNQLFVVCEDSVCNPVGHPKYEIAAFGWAKIDREEDFDGIKVYRMIHNPTGAP